MTPKKYPQNLNAPKNIHFSENPKKYWNSEFWTQKNGPSLRICENIRVPPWGWVRISKMVWFSYNISTIWPLQSLYSLNNIIELRHSDFQQYGMCDQQSVRSACAYAQSDQSLCLSLEYSMGVKLLTEHHLECLSLKGGCTGSSESTLVKIPHC